ncbi:hypothetical protein RHMOL_Rhmol02G0199500 [Rhododendron molle]|uniref:Uncharacterized protein n=1 Tax=Rhododendron molle TaxID=49168 RepID=A0ACC0PTG6_RHOML|nr:hypothetical protein RHMOL_Rhmol02G0199500 [Rhododendron molle]
MAKLRIKDNNKPPPQHRCHNHHTNHRNHNSPYCRHAQSQHTISIHSIATNPAKSHHHTTRNSQAKRPAISNKVERQSTTGSKKPAERDTPSRVSDGILPEGGGGGNEEGGEKGKREEGNNSPRKRGALAREGEKKNEDKERRPGEEAAPPPSKQRRLGFLWKKIRSVVFSRFCHSHHLFFLTRFTCMQA